MSDLNPACADCHIRRRKPGCGYLAARTPCQHPEHKAEWAACLRKSRNVTSAVTSDDYVKYRGIGTAEGFGDMEGEQ